MIAEALDCCLEKSPGHLQLRILLPNTFRFKKPLSVMEQKRIDPHSRGTFAELFNALMQELGAVHRHVFCHLACNSVNQLSFCVRHDFPELV
jgi:hypothetical protein